MPKRKKLDTNHCWLHIATVDEDAEPLGPQADRWYWCSECGALSRSFVEYWKWPFTVRGSLNARTLPKGAPHAPYCEVE